MYFLNCCYSFNLWLFFYFSGETAFSNVSQYLEYSKNPLIRRIKDLDKNLPITVLYGEDSWVADLFPFPFLKNELLDIATAVQRLFTKLVTMFILIILMTLIDM